MTSRLLPWLLIKRRNQIDLFKKYPIEVQQETLFDLLSKASNTEWGKKYNFKSIETYEDFKKNVPINDYESIKGDVQRLLKGEKNIMWPGAIKWFAKSSGTTSDKSKFIPVSKEAMNECHFKGGKDVIAIYSKNNPKTKIYSKLGKSLIIGGSHSINNINQDSYFGDLSAVLIENMPFWANFVSTPNKSIALMDEWEEKIEKMAEATINVNVTNIGGVPSWVLVLIDHVLKKTGKKDLKEVWPNLELFIHGGVSFTPYREQFKKLIKDSKMNYLETYNASEGFFAIQDDPKTQDMLLMLDYGIFFEFIPMEHINDKNPITLSLGEIELGKNYAMLISTNAGLWRYMIGDTVIFTNKTPFKIKISGRTKHFINAFGEEVIIDNADKAFKEACSKTNAQIREYTGAPVFLEDGKKGRHQWLIEFENEPKDIKLFAKTFDLALQNINSDYEAKRYKGMILEEAEIVIAKPETFHKWLKQKGKLGGQHKVPRLANDRKFITDLLKINSSTS